MQIILPIMALIPRGEFRMGSPTAEIGRKTDEGPTRTVTINYELEVGKYPVTFDEWDAAATMGAVNGYRPFDEGWGRGNRPVVNVSWVDAHGYISWLNDRLGSNFRLLSEAEWEYCCRSNSATRYSFGDEIHREQAAFDCPCTLPVDAFPENRFGLVGMHGNVWEWCQDKWNEDYSEAHSDGSPMETGTIKRVVRGGSWFNGARSLRSAERGRGGVTHRNGYRGFRIARTKHN